MILKNQLYTINDSRTEDTAIVYDLTLQSDHFIFQAHFPGEPITPGVCIIQIAKELLEDHLHRSLAVKTVKNVKFLSVVSPLQHPQVRYAFTQIQEFPDGVKVIVDVTASDIHMTHLSFTCR